MVRTRPNRQENEPGEEPGQEQEQVQEEEQEREEERGRGNRDVERHDLWREQAFLLSRVIAFSVVRFYLAFFIVCLHDG